jgi:hypothetical protein
MSGAPSSAIACILTTPYNLLRYSSNEPSLNLFSVSICRHATTRFHSESDYCQVSSLS